MDKPNTYKPNTYKGFNGKIYKAEALTIFMCPSANGREEWHVSGVESDCYLIYRGTPYSNEALIKAADRVIRTKYEFIGEIAFVIRETPLKLS